MPEADTRAVTRMRIDSKHVLSIHFAVVATRSACSPYATFVYSSAGLGHPNVACDASCGAGLSRALRACVTPAAAVTTGDVTSAAGVIDAVSSNNTNAGPMQSRAGKRSRSTGVTSGAVTVIGVTAAGGCCDAHVQRLAAKVGSAYPSEATLFPVV